MIVVVGDVISNDAARLAALDRPHRRSIRVATAETCISTSVTSAPYCLPVLIKAQRHLSTAAVTDSDAEAQTGTRTYTPLDRQPIITRKKTRLTWRGLAMDARGTVTVGQLHALVGGEGRIVDVFSVPVSSRFSMRQGNGRPRARAYVIMFSSWLRLKCSPSNMMASPCVVPETWRSFPAETGSPPARSV